MSFIKLVLAFIAAVKYRLSAPARWYRTAQQRVDPVPDDAGLLAKAGQRFDLVDVTLTIGIASVVGYVVLFVNSQTEEAAQFTAGSNFDNASNSLSGGLETAFSMYEVVFIAILLAIIVGALMVVRRR